MLDDRAGGDPRAKLVSPSLRSGGVTDGWVQVGHR